MAYIQIDRSKLALRSSPGTKPTLLLHPLLLFSLVWVGVVSLYALHLSHLLVYSTREVLQTTLYIWLPFVAAVGVFYLSRSFVRLAYPGAGSIEPPDSELLERRLRLWFRLWFLITCVEIVVSGGVPILWLIRHSSKIYADFGITSVHGLVNSLLLSIGLCRFALFLVTGNKRQLAIPAFIFLWSITIINRNMMLVSLLEFGILYMRVKPVRFLTILRVVAGLMTFVLLFGIVGDLRQGSTDSFLGLAQPTEQYPTWLPSGVLWAYIYTTTPINNLVYTIHSVYPANNVLFPSTAASLFPTVIRNVIYGAQVDQAESGDLVSNAFNVSTAYIGPYQDFGFIGMVLFSVGAALVSQIYWFRNDIKGILVFAVLSQCVVLTLFFNHFFALPIIAQVVWFYYFFMREITIGEPTIVSTRALPAR